MSRRSADTRNSGWTSVEKRRLLAGLESGVWSLAGACYRFGVSPDEIRHWQRSLQGLHPAAAGTREHGLELYVELL